MTDGARDWSGLAGRIEGRRHILPVRVYHEDTDFTGLVYHASFIRFCERGRSDFVRLLGIHHQDLLQAEAGGEPAAFVVRHMEIDFLRPARIDDVVEVVTHCAELGGASLTLAQDVMCDGRTLVRARVKIVLLSQSGKPMRVGALMRPALERFVNEEE